MDYSTPGFPILHHLPELAQTHVHWVSDAKQPSHPLSSPSPPAFNLSQHQGLFQGVASGGQSIGASVSASVLPMNIQDWFPLRLIGLISLLSKGVSRVFSNTTVQKHQFFGAFFMIQLSDLYITTGKTIALSVGTFVGKVMSLLFNMLSRFFYSFSFKEQVFFNFMAAVAICSDFGAQENKVCHCFHCFPIYLPWSSETRCHDLSFLNVNFKMGTWK